MSDPYNKEITAQLKEGNEKAFKLIINADYNNIVFFANQYLKDYMLSQDVAQETFITLWNTRDSLNPELNLRSYIFTIARNKALNLMRRKCYSATDSLDKKEIQISMNAISCEYVDEKIDSLTLEEIICKTYSKLPEQVRMSFFMNREMGLTYEQISRINGISVKVVEYHISTALKLFRKKLKNFLGFFSGLFI
jgi:RNA polymerase sigma-70 factor (ECF subfamily)